MEDDGSRHYIAQSPTHWYPPLSELDQQPYHEIDPNGVLLEHASSAGGTTARAICFVLAAAKALMAVSARHLRQRGRERSGKDEDDSRYDEFHH